MQLSKAMARLLKCGLAKPGGRYTYAFDHVCAKKGTLLATNGHVCISVGFAGQQLQDGLYRLDGQTLVFVAEVSKDRSMHYWPDIQACWPSELFRKAYPICLGIGTWSVAVLNLCIEKRCYLDVFRYGNVFRACEGLAIQYGMNGQGMFSTYRDTDSVRINFSYTGKEKGFDRGDVVDVELWFSQFNHGEDAREIELTTEKAA